MEKRGSARNRDAGPSDISAFAADFLVEKSVPLGIHSPSLGAPGQLAARRPVDRDPTTPIAVPSDDTVEVISSHESAASDKQLLSPLLEATSSTEPEAVSAVALTQGEFPPGAVLGGRFVILDTPEKSGMGMVYKALDRQREIAGHAKPWVALKVARSKHTNVGDTRVHLRQEFLTLSRLRHRNIVAVFDIARDGEAEFMVLEWLSGQTLAELLLHMGTKRLALAVSRDIIASVAAALAEAHSAGVIHGDVKPSNIFITTEGTVKLLDFGTSSRVPPGDSASDRRSWATRSYASCSVLEGNSPRPTDDVFALGVTAYRLLSGKWPFGECDALAAKRKGIEPAELPDDPFGCGAAVQSAVHLDASERPVDAVEFLRRFVSESDSPGTAESPSRPLPPLFRPTRWAGMAAMIVSFLAVILILVTTLPDEVPAPTKIEREIESAGAAFANGQLLEPVGDSAFDRYQTVLVFEPDNIQAHRGLDAIADQFLDRARAALLAEDLDGAAANLQKARQVRPDRVGILLMQDLVDSYQSKLLLRARQAAGSDTGLADQYLARAETLANEEDLSAAEVRRERQALRVMSELESLLAGIDARILSERLVLPEGDSAVDLLQRAREIDGENRAVQRAGDRITSALLFQALFAISNGNLDRAQSFISAADSLGIKHIALGRAKYELAKARNAVL